MSLTIVQCEQRTDEWYAARLGMVTASSVGALLTPAGRVADNDTARRYITALASERIAGYAEPGRISADMWRGIEEEPLARDAYAEHEAIPVAECGLMVRDDYISYSSGMALWIRRVYPDDGWHKAIIAAVSEAEARITRINNTYRERTDGLPVMPRTPTYDIEV